MGLGFGSGVGLSICFGFWEKTSSVRLVRWNNQFHFLWRRTFVGHLWSNPLIKSLSWVWLQRAAYVIHAAISTCLSCCSSHSVQDKKAGQAPAFCTFLRPPENSANAQFGTDWILTVVVANCHKPIAELQTATATTSGQTKCYFASQQHTESD